MAANTHTFNSISSAIRIFPYIQMQLNKVHHLQTNSMEEMITLYHSHALSPNQCSSIVSQTIHAPLPLVWSMVRQFNNPQSYKQFVKSCDLISGHGGAGSVRELKVVSGLPAARSTERLDRLDDDLRVMVVSIIGGDHKLVNYRSTTTLHEDDGKKGGGGGRTVVIESYVVDIPADSCEEDTCLFTDTIISCNLKSLAKIAEKMACKEAPQSWVCNID